jgi:hypothetical protein
MICTVSIIAVEPIKTVRFAILLEGVVMCNYLNEQRKGICQSGVSEHIASFLDKKKTLIGIRPVSKLFCILPISVEWRLNFPAKELWDKNLRFIESKRMMTFLLSKRIDLHIQLILRLKKVFLYTNCGGGVKNIIYLYEKTEASMFDLIDVRQFQRWNWSPVRRAIHECQQLAQHVDIEDPNWTSFCDDEEIIHVFAKAFRNAMKFI